MQQAGVRRGASRNTTSRPSSRPPNRPGRQSARAGMFPSTHSCAASTARRPGISALTHSAGSPARNSASTASCTRPASPAAARPAADAFRAHAPAAARSIAAMWSVSTSPCTRPAAPAPVQLRMLGQPGGVGPKKSVDEDRCRRRRPKAGPQSCRPQGRAALLAAGQSRLIRRSAGRSSPVGEERGEALVGQRMVEQLPQHRRRHAWRHARPASPPPPRASGFAPRPPAPRS